MKQTAIQELIDELKPFLEDNVVNVGIKIAIRYAELQLEKERQQIIEAFENCFEPEFGHGEQYYNSTFKND